MARRFSTLCPFLFQNLLFRFNPGWGADFDHNSFQAGLGWAELCWAVLSWAGRAGLGWPGSPRLGWAAQAARWLGWEAARLGWAGLAELSEQWQGVLKCSIQAPTGITDSMDQCSKVDMEA